MSNAIGAALPPELLALLDGSRAEEQRGKVVVVATVDDGGFPHMSLLSPGEMLALDERRIRLALFAGGQTLHNIAERRAVVLVFVDAGLSYYVRGNARPTNIEVPPGPTQPLGARVVEVTIDQVFQDSEAGAWITTGARYERNIPPDDELREWQRTWSALRAT